MTTPWQQHYMTKVAKMDAEALDKQVEYLIAHPYTLMEHRYAAVLERVAEILQDKHDTLQLERMKRPIRFMMHVLARKSVGYIKSCYGFSATHPDTF